MVEYEMVSGQLINVDKSRLFVFAKGRKDNVMIELEIRKVLTQEKYLGYP